MYMIQYIVLTTLQLSILMLYEAILTFKNIFKNILY